MLRMSVASAVLACAAAPILAPASAAQGKGHGDSHAERGAPGHANKDDAKAKPKAKITNEKADDRDRAKAAHGEPGSERAQSLEKGSGHPADRPVRTVRNLRVADDRLGDDRRDRREREPMLAFIPACPPGLVEKHDGCLPPGQARKKRNDVFGYDYRPGLFGVRAQNQADYVYYDGYLVPVGEARASYVPLMGGALAVGRLWPATYPSYTLPDWQRSYYGFDEPRNYHYADNVVYRVDPDTAAIEAVAALLTGSDFNVGSPLPSGYDVYNVPAAFQSQYADSDEALYRYADGRVYQVDPASMLISKAIDLLL